MRWRSPSVASTALFVVLSLAGCASIARRAFVTPVVGVQQTRVRSLSTRGGSLDVTLQVENPNDFRLDVGRVRYALWVDSVQVATGEVARVVTLEPRATTTVAVPVDFALDAVAMVAVRFMTTGGLRYRVTGQFDYVTPFGRLTRPFVSDGQVGR